MPIVHQLIHPNINATNDIITVTEVPSINKLLYLLKKLKSILSSPKLFMPIVHQLTL